MCAFQFIIVRRLPRMIGLLSFFNCVIQRKMVMIMDDAVYLVIMFIMNDCESYLNE